MMIKHLGDITKINGAEIHVVDIITGGSPCQDLSVAGLRKGLQHGELGDEETTRSGLFMEQLRIVKEMRAKDVQRGRNGIDVRPRYMVWENVPGAFSVNQGKDFQAVLTEIVRVVEPTAPDVPMPEKGWPKAGCLYGELGNWSIAYRVHDAQYWGVPQRRKRIALVADFNGLSAPEILFDPQLRGETESPESNETVSDSGAERGGSEIPSVGESLSGDSEPSGTAREGTARSSAEGADGTGDGITPPPVRDSYAVDCRNGAENPFCERDSAIEERGSQPQYEHGCKGPVSKSFQNTGHGWWNESSVATSVRTPAGGGGKEANIVAGFSFGQSAKARSLGYQEEVSPTVRGGEGGN